MIAKQSWKPIVLFVTVLVAACSTHDETKDTPASRCQRICAASADGPCAGRTDDACAASCVARLTDKSEACQSCLHAQSGWKGVRCTCDDALGGLGSLTCKTCRSLGASSSCTTEVTGSCSVAESCDGLVIAPVGEPNCASVCGEVATNDPDAGATSTEDAADACGSIVTTPGQTCVGFGAYTRCDPSCGQAYGYVCFDGAPPSFDGCRKVRDEPTGQTYCCPKNDCVAQPDQDSMCSATASKPHRFQCPPDGSGGHVAPPAGCEELGSGPGIVEKFYCCP